MPADPMLQILQQLQGNSFNPPVDYKGPKVIHWVNCMEDNAHVLVGPWKTPQVGVAGNLGHVPEEEFDRVGDQRTLPRMLYEVMQSLKRLPRLKNAEVAKLRAEPHGPAEPAGATGLGKLDTANGECGRKLEKEGAGRQRQREGQRQRERGRQTHLQRERRRGEGVL